MTHGAASQVAQERVVRPLIEALYYAGIARPRVRPEMDISGVGFLPEYFWQRYSHWPEGDLLPPRGPKIHLPGSVDSHGEKQLVLP